MATLVNSLQNRVKSITLCVILNANTGKIVLVTLCIQIEWLLYNAFWCETNTKVTLTPSRARGHVPPLLQMTGHRGTESKKNKKQESDQTVLTTLKCLPKRLSLIAQDILAAPSSQAYVEKGFSVCGLLTAGRRNRIAESLQMQAFLKLNKKVLANTGINASV